ncbi:hypothetical protein Tco_0746594 [Tanacetum coccineum]
MTKQGNFTQRTPQAKKQSDQASKQVSKQASGSTLPHESGLFQRTGPSWDNPANRTHKSQALRSTRVCFQPPLLQTGARRRIHRAATPPIRNKGPELRADNLTLEGSATD